MKYQIMMVRGDSLKIKTKIFIGNTGRLYLPDEGDTLFMDIRKTAYDGPAVISMSCPAAEGVFMLKPSDTAALKPDNYYFDLRLLGKGGNVYTVCPIHCIRIVKNITEISTSQCSTSEIIAEKTLICRIENSAIDGAPVISEGSQETAVTSYAALTDKPTLNGHILSGNMTSADLDLLTETAVSGMIEENRPSINGHTLSGNSTLAQLGIDIPSDEHIGELISGELANYVPCDRTARDAAEVHAQNTSNPHRVTFAQTGGIGENLLINSDFTNPVNQRGITYITSPFSTYFIDRWRCFNNFSGNSLTLTADGLSFSIAENYVDISYSFEPAYFSKLSGRRTTLSVCIDGTVITFTFTLGNHHNNRIAEMINFSTAWDSNSPNKMMFRVMRSAVISWVKLEAGESATPLLPVCPAAELSRCRYYYRRSTQNLSAELAFSKEMRLPSPQQTSISGGYAYDAEIY